MRMTWEQCIGLFPPSKCLANPQFGRDFHIVWVPTPAVKSRKQKIHVATEKAKDLTTRILKKLETGLNRPATLMKSRSRPPPLGTAGLAVLNTFELAEEILSYLKFEELIWATQVCRSWHTIILTSKLLRQRLLHEPINQECDDMYVPARGGESEARYIHHSSHGIGQIGYWFVRFEAESVHKFDPDHWRDGDGKVIIYRTPEVHIELFIQHELDQEPPLLAPHRTRVTEQTIQGRRWWCNYQGVLEGFDTRGKVAWRSVYMRIVSDHWRYIVHNLGESM